MTNTLINSQLPKKKAYTEIKILGMLKYFTLAESGLNNLIILQ